MACGARSGLKPLLIIETFVSLLRLNGLWSPFGIETKVWIIKCDPALAAKWPVEPVRD